LKPLIFISHSAKDNLSQQVLLKLYRVLSKRFEVLLDRERLQPNDAWRQELHAWMALCHGAVVLLSEHAQKTSPWVKKEATVLSFRREEDENFILTPVLLPPVTHGDLADGDFAPLGLNEIQMAEGDDPTALAEQVLRQFEPLLERLGTQTALQRVEGVVASLLREVEGKDYTILLKAAEHLGRRLKWRTDRSYSSQLARELLTAEIEDILEVIVFLTPYFEQKHKVNRILDQLIPFWVNPEAVAELPRMNRRPRGRRVVSVNGVEYPFTGECYIRRACSSTYDWVSARLTEPRGFEETPEVQIKLLEEEIRRQLFAQIGFDEDAPVEQGELDANFNEMEEREPFFILVPDGIDEEILDGLRRRYESFTFFLLRDEGASDREDLAGRHVLHLRPELKPGRDSQVRKLIRETKGKIMRTR
jgi:hypothetical protein